MNCPFLISISILCSHRPGSVQVSLQCPHSHNSSLSSVKAACDMKNLQQNVPPKTGAKWLGGENLLQCNSLASMKEQLKELRNAVS